MSRHVQFTLDDAKNFSILADHETCAFARQGADSLYAKKAGDFPVRI